MPTDTRPGPKSWHRPKGEPLSVALTDQAKVLLGTACRREGGSRADLIEQLIRSFWHRVRRPR